MQDAINAYKATTKISSNPKNIEVSLLLNAASMLSEARDCLPDERKLEDALTYNRKLWTVFVSSLARDDNPMDKTIRKNLLSLGAYVFKQSIRILGEPKAHVIDSIIDINMNIAQGLKGNS